MEKIKIAIIDDKKTILDRFQSNYDGDDYEIHTFLSLEDAIPAIDKDFYSFHFIILDGKGYTKTEETGEGDEKFALLARDEIQKLIEKKGRDMPFCYYTAYSEEKILQVLPSFTYSGTNEPVKVFKKQDENVEQKMFSFIRERYEKLEETTIRKKYSDVFEVFQFGLLNVSVERDLINTIKLSNNLTDDNAKQISRNIRPLMESLFYKLIEIDRKFLPENFNRGNIQSLTNLMKFLAGSPTWNNANRTTEFTSRVFLPTHLYDLILGIQKSSSASAMHEYHEKINRYTAQAYLNGLFDLIIWFKELVKN